MQLFPTHTTYMTIITTITIRYPYLLTTFLQVKLVRYTSHTTIRYSDHNLFVSANLYSLEAKNFNPQLHTDWLPALSSSFICPHLHSTECSQNRRFAFLPFREFYLNSLCMCILILVCPSCLLLLIHLEDVRCICILCTHRLLLFSISFKLMVFVYYSQCWTILGRFDFCNNI